MTATIQSVLHYSILGELGAGGMGVVFRALDTRLDRAVALKFLPEGLRVSPDAKRRLLLEAQAAAKLDHPNIGTIHSIEEADGHLFIVMALYEGESLKERLARGPLALDEALDVALQAARGLARAHERGLIHRDVKPGNLFLCRDGLLKVLDFGLAKSGDGEGLTQPGALVGTPEYMAPEQVRGQPLDARADLWALGAVLYEMLTGTSPFRAEGGVAATVYRILQADPPPVTELRPELPEEVRELVERALAKDRDERPDSAEAFADDLASLASGGRPAAPPRAAPAPSPRGPATGGSVATDDAGPGGSGDAGSSALLEPVPRAPRFLGREAELAALRARLERDRIVAVRGMAGAGKSTLGARLARELVPEERIFWFTFDPVEKNTADALYWSLAAYLRARGEPLLWRYLRGEIEAHQPLDRTARLNLLLSSLASEDAVFCFDDVHLVGDATDIVELLKGMKRHVADGAHASGARFVFLGRELPRELEHLAEPLAGLSEGGAAALLAAQGLELPDDVARRLWERTLGNPTLLELAASALARHRGDAAALAEFVESMAGRGDIRDYVMNHVHADLPDDDKAVLDALSIFPAAVELEIVEEVLAEEGLSGIVPRVDDLIERAIVQESEDGQIFCHDLVREFCYRALDRRRRLRLHASAAATYEARGRFVPAAHHALARDDAEGALALLIDNVRDILNAGGAANLLELLPRFDRDALDEDVLVQLYRAWSDALLIRGQFREAVELLEGVLDDVLDDGGQGELLCRLGSAYDRLGDYPRAVAAARGALEAFEAAGDRKGVAQIHRVLGWALYRMGRLEPAEETFEAGRALAEELDDPALLATFDNGLGSIDVRHGRYEEARGRLEASRKNFRRLRDRLGEAEATGNLALLHARLGQPDRELALDQKVLALLESIGDVGNLLILHNNLADLHHREGQMEEAVANYEKLATLARRLDHAAWLNAAHVGLAETHLALDRPQAALVHAQAAYEIALGFEDRDAHQVELGMSGLALGSVHLALGNPGEARHWFATSIPQLEAAREDAEVGKARRGYEAALALDGGAKSSGMGEPR